AVSIPLTAMKMADDHESPKAAFRHVGDSVTQSRMRFSVHTGVGSDHRRLTAYQIGCEIGQSVVLVLRPAILNRHILALDVAGFTEALAECGQKAGISRPRAVEESYHRHRRLLRARRERPCGGCTAE